MHHRDGFEHRLYLLDLPACLAQGPPWSSTGTICYGGRVDLDFWPHIWQDEWWQGEPAPLSRAFPKWGTKRTERLSARSSSLRDGWRGGLSSRLTTYERFLHATWVWARVFVLWRAGPHRKSRRLMRDAANCLCLLGCLATAWQQPPVHAEQGGLQKHSPSICRTRQGQAGCLRWLVL